MNILLHWLISALLLLLIAYVVPGIFMQNFGTALFAALILGLVNILIKPFLLILTLPINILTLGLFSLVINALMLALTAYLLPGFEISGFLSAFVGALLLSLITLLIGSRPSPA